MRKLVLIASVLGVAATYIDASTQNFQWGFSPRQFDLDTFMGIGLGFVPGLILAFLFEAKAKFWFACMFGSLVGIYKAHAIYTVQTGGFGFVESLGHFAANHTMTMVFGFVAVVSLGSLLANPNKSEGNE